MDFRGFGVITDFGERIYNARLGKFLSVDPLIRSFPSVSPYLYANNDPIFFIDKYGESPGPGPSSAAQVMPVRPPLEVIRGGRFPMTGRPPGYEATPNGPTIGYSASGEPFLIPGNLSDFGYDSRRALEENKKNLFLAGHVRIKGTWELEPDYRTRQKLRQQNTETLSELKDVRNETEKAAQMAINRANGRAWETVVQRLIEKDPSTVQNFSQVTLLVTGQLNGKDLSFRVKVDNLTYTTAGKLNINEAKFSITQINYNNFEFSLTGKQKDAYALFTNGTNVNVFLRTDKLNQPGGLNLQKGTNITTLIDQIKIIPNKPNNQSNTNTGSTLNGTRSN